MTQLVVLPPSLQVGSDVAVPMARAELTPDERTEMLALIQSHFDGVCDEVFHRDLDDKDWVLRIVRDGTLVGAPGCGQPVRTNSRSSSTA